MQILDLEQGSPEWLKARLGVATASNFSKIVTTQGKESTAIDKYALELASEMLLSKPDSTYKNENMQRGNDLEGKARQAYQEHTLNFVEEIGFIKSDCNNYGYSPDGLVDDDGLIEIKCPLATTHLQYLIDDKLPTAYFQQCQGGLFVSGRKWLDFVSYHPNFKDGKDLFIKRVFRDEDFIKTLKQQINKVILLRDDLVAKIVKKEEFINYLNAG